MIFYLAILLILCGFLIIISVLFIEIRETKRVEEYPPAKIKTAEEYSSIKDSGKRPAPVKIKKQEEYRPIKPPKEYKPIKTKSPDNFESVIHELNDLEIITPDELDSKDNIFSEFEDKYPDLFEPEQVLDMEEFDIKSTLPLKEENKDIVYAVMFDDRSGIIDYTSGVGIIDSTFLKYKDIKRIGRGIIESDSYGINFYLDEKLYRFDSHRIYDIYCGDNYVALPLKGDGIVKLFLIENSSDFSFKVEADFKGAHE